MAKNYEFLVAGLPDLLMEDNKNVQPFGRFMDEVREQATPEDFEVIRAMALPIDNRNLVSVLESDGGDFDARGRYSQEELADAVKSPEALPAYMQKFLEAHKENRPVQPGLTPIDHLTWLFHDEMAESRNVFLREWFDFDVNLRNVAAGINIRKGLTHIEALATDRDRPGAFTLIGRGDVAEAVLRSAAPDFGLTATYPWIEKAITLSKSTLTDMEKGLDDLRWEMLNELTINSYFTADVIAAFTQKLLIIERWMTLQPTAGREKLDKLVSELMESFVMPEGFQ
jgi:hypothetical protein